MPQVITELKLVNMLRMRHGSRRPAPRSKMSSTVPIRISGPLTPAPTMVVGQYLCLYRSPVSSISEAMMNEPAPMPPRKR